MLCRRPLCLRNLSCYSIPHVAPEFLSGGDTVATCHHSGVKRDATSPLHRADSMPTISKRFVDAADPGRHYDDKLAGFGLYVGASGVRSYFFEYRPGRGRGVQKRRISIGKHGAPWTPQAARTKRSSTLRQSRTGATRSSSASSPRVGRTVRGVSRSWSRSGSSVIRPATARGMRSSASCGGRSCRVGGSSRSRASASATSLR